MVKNRIYHQLPENYYFREGEAKDRALLVKFMRHTYKELFPYQQHFVHLIKTVDDYFSRETPLWWIETSDSTTVDQTRKTQIACLWMGNGIDQVKGDRYSHIFLLYVLPEYRQQGLGTALMNQAITYAQDRGDRQIGLQVFTHNQPALKMYQSLGFHTQSLSMFKSLES
jgi:ribosomal protein S18 acetylase RimI-like enzyme